MKLRDLLRKCPYKKIFNAIYRNYYLNKNYNQSDITELDLAYLSVFEKLIDLPKSNTIKYDLILKSVNSEEGKFIDVLLLEKSSNEEFSVDFVSWSELIDSNVVMDSKMRLPLALCHILWEMTFWGFSEKEILKQKKITIDSAESGKYENFDLDCLKNVYL